MTLIQQNSANMNFVAHHFVLCFCLTVVGLALPVTAQIDAETFRLLNSFEPFYLKYKAASALAEWNYQTNMTSFNQEILVRKIYVITYDNFVNYISLELHANQARNIGGRKGFSKN